jgi:hypothetical protein
MMSERLSKLLDTLHDYQNLAFQLKGTADGDAAAKVCWYLDGVIKTHLMRDPYRD